LLRRYAVDGSRSAFHICNPPFVSEWCHLGDAEHFDFVPPPLPRESSAAEDMEGYAAVRGNCFMRTDVKLMTSAHRRSLSRTRRNYWTGFRPAFLHTWCLAQKEERGNE
jgi:hypothetical protein